VARSPATRPPLLLSLEELTPGTDTATKTAIFRERTIQRRRRSSARRREGGARHHAHRRARRSRHMETVGNADAFLDWGRAVLNRRPDVGRPTTNTFRATSGKNCGPSRRQKRRDLSGQRRGVEPCSRGCKATEIDARLGKSGSARTVAQFGASCCRPTPARRARGSCAAARLWTSNQPYAKNGVANRTNGARPVRLQLIEHALNQRRPTVYDLRRKEKFRTSTPPHGSRRRRHRKSKTVRRIALEDTPAQRLAGPTTQFNNGAAHVQRDHLQLRGEPDDHAAGTTEGGRWRILQRPYSLDMWCSGQDYHDRRRMELKRLGLARNRLFFVMPAISRRSS